MGYVKHKSNNKSILFNRGSKKFIAKLLSDEKNKLTRHDLNNIEKEFDNQDKEFYQSKINKKRYKKRPKNFNTKNYRKFNDASPKRKSALKKLNKYLNELPLPKYLFSKTEKDFYKNARKHYGNTNFVLMDVKSFFPNCKFEMIKDFFVRNSGLRMKPDLADRMAKLVTRPKSTKSKIREAPQGFPTSPIICFLAYKPMFDRINTYARQNNLTFSTYVDDLTFSSQQTINSEKIINDVILILEEYGHTSKKEKCKSINIVTDKIAPTITGIWLKRYKLRASSKIYNKMYRSYMYLISTKIDSPDKYILSWKNFVIVNGISQTLNYIEPQTKSKRQDVIDYIKKNKSKYILTVSPNDKRLKSKKMREKLYGAYLYGTLKEFSKQFVNN